jgi:acyl-CoA thioester hydrolase
MALADFRCIMRFRVPFHDVDMVQHVNNASYVTWAETIRCNYFSEVLGESLVGANGIIVARLVFDYEHTLEYREEVAIGCRVVRMGRKSFDFLYEIWSETRKERAAHGSSIMVAFDHQTKSSIVVPQRWREKITSYEAVAPVTNS